MKTQFCRQRRSRSLLLSTMLALVFAASAVAICAPPGSDEWRPLDPSDLALKAATVEPDADAEAIFWDIRIDDGGQNDLVLSHYLRIKVFNQRGAQQESKIDIPYFGGTKIKDIAARTIKSDGSILELAKEDIVERVVVKTGGLKLKVKSFALPGIEPGAIIEYKWKETVSNSSANNLRLDFQRDIPVQSITYHVKPSTNMSGVFDVQGFNMRRPIFEKEKNGFQSTTVTNMPAFHEEPLMPPEENVRSWAMIKYQNIITTLFGYDLLARQVYLGAQTYLKADDEIKRKSAEIVAGANTPEEKLAKIFDFCRTSIRNTSDRHSGFTAEEIGKLKENKKSADTLKRGVGPAGDINMLFAALANAAGLEARVALAPDRGRRFFDRAVIIPGALRPSNIAVRFGDNWRFFDPGFHYITFGMLRWQEEGVDALIADDSPAWIKTPLSPPAESRESRIATLRLDENGTLEGDVTIEYTGHLAVERKTQNDDDSSNQREESLKLEMKNRLSSAELTNIVIENVTDQVKPFVYKYHVRVPEYAQRTGTRLFLQPAFFQKGIPALFASSARRYPIYFHFPWSEEDKVTITLPKGYSLDNADAPTPIGAGETAGYVVKMQVSNDQSILIYNRSFFFGGGGTLLFPAASYSQLKRLFDEVNKADGHTITLKQKAVAN